MNPSGLLVVRPEPGNARTIARLRAGGGAVLGRPLFAAAPIACARSGVSASTCAATPAPSLATSTSRPGSRNSSIPRQASVIWHAPAPAASNSRVAGDQPLATMLSRCTLSTASVEQFTALWSPV